MGLLALEPMVPEPAWPAPGCVLGIAFPGAVPTDGEPGWAVDGAGCGFVGPGVPDPDPDAPEPAPGAGALLLPEPVVCAIAGPISSAVMPPSATYVSHRVLM
jgi:hypothetical protein